MGRWGWRQVATLCVMVLVMAACDLAAPDNTLDPTQSPQATLLLRTVSHTVSPPPVSRTPGGVGAAQPAASLPAPRTPRPAPTPTYYTVAAGDTLASIAARFGITVRALQDANGDLPPSLVIPGQVLLIPLPEVSPTTDLTLTLARYLPTATPLPLPVAPPACYPTPAAEVLCLGWVANALAEPVLGVSVRVALLDAAGGVVAERVVGVAQSLVPPGAGVPYAARFPHAPGYATVAAQLLSAAAVEASPVVPLAVESPTMMAEGELIRVSGVLRHAGSEPLGDLVVVGVLFDAADRVTGYRVLRPVEPLAPGESRPVDLLITPLASGSVRHWLYAEGTVLGE